MSERLPVLLVTGTVWLYWLSVLGMIVRSRLRHQAAAGAVPSIGRERWMWLVWVPTVIAWHLLPVVALYTDNVFLSVPAWISGAATTPLSWIAVVLAFCAYGFTVPCWLAMGSNWSLAVVPNKETSLITDGWYARVRHPIYSLGLLLMLATVLASPSPAVLLLAASHTTLIVLKVSGEERYLRQRHGQAYLDYCQHTGRLFPRFSSGGTAGTHLQRQS